MRELLKEISELAIRSENFNFTPQQKNNNWLGKDPTTNKQIIDAEKRLGIKFPSDYIEFLLITNGFSAPNDIEPSFEIIEKVNYLKNIDEFCIEAYSHISSDLSNSIIIGGIDEEQYFLLIPPSSHLEKWKYWKFANWLPGEQRFENLKAYFNSVLEFVKAEYED